MATLASQVKQMLDAAVAAPGGPAGLVFGAVNARGDVLVAEAAGRRALDSPDPVRRTVCSGERC